MRLHFVGIGGSGISGVAHLALRFGHEVTGCDLETGGHDVSHIENKDLIIVTPAVFYQNAKHPEVVEAKKRGILMTWQEFLGNHLLKNKRLICIAGTHGKSTTTGMVGKMLIDNGFDPIVVIGANVPEWGGNSRFGKGEYAIVEADEFNNNFLFYHPEIAIINNIEFDHPDFFKSEEEVFESFRKFKENLIGPKILITEKDSLNKKFNLKIFGEHNQKNANMAYVLGQKLGIRNEEIVKSIESFTGIGRRMELIAERNGIKVYDDYGHHPTAIKTTLEGVRNAYPNSKILVINEPHGYKRTKALLQQYKGVFDSADKVLIGPIFQARDEVDKSVTPQIVAKVSNHKDATGFDSFESVIENYKFLPAQAGKIKNYDIVVVMGAGKSYLWALKIRDEFSGQAQMKFSDLTTFRIGGKINKYFEVKNDNEVVEAVLYAKGHKLSIFIIGEGTDILVSDKDFDGVVIKYVGKELTINNDELTAEAGMNWDELVEIAVNKGLQGIESLSGIPGTVGAAPIQNIGAYGHELKETFVSLKAYDIEKQKFATFLKDECKFGYRDSIFKEKNHWQKFIIVSVTLKLKKYTDKELDLNTIREEILRVRSEKLENPKEIGNAGSFFKNPIISPEEKDRLITKFKDIVIFPFGDRFKISAGWLIEQTGWKGKSFKSAAVSSKHALILVNPEGRAKAEDVLDLSQKIIDDVYDKFGIKLEREVQLINF